LHLIVKVAALFWVGQAGPLELSEVGEAGNHAVAAAAIAVSQLSQSLDYSYKTKRINKIKRK
jgi:hypothetical protein